MNYLLNEFWRWANLSPEQYSYFGVKLLNDREECNFPQFTQLLEYAKKIIDDNIIDNVSIDEFLTILALDNESENTLDYAVDNSSSKQLNQIIHLGLTHLQPEARWQIAEMIYRRKPDDYFALLNILLNDSHPYVQKRALNCIRYLSSNQ